MKPLAMTDAQSYLPLWSIVKHGEWRLSARPALGINPTTRNEINYLVKINELQRKEIIALRQQVMRLSDENTLLKRDNMHSSSSARSKDNNTKKRSRFDLVEMCGVHYDI